MTLQASPANLSLSSAPQPPARARPAPGQGRKFAITVVLFLMGFVLTAGVFDRVMGVYLRKTGQQGLLGGEVYWAARWAKLHTPGIDTIFVGDSVAHQLFSPGTEPAGVRFLTTNQAVSAAGQCYLIEDALKHYPDLKDVYIFYLPAAWANNLPRELTRDYFCANFRRPAQVAEVFKVKRDFELSFAHLGRCLLPNTMEANSLQRPAFSLEPAAQPSGPPHVAGAAPPPPDPEPTLTLLSRWFAPPPPRIPAVTPGHQPVSLSPVSRYYLAKMRRLCAARGVRLHVLSCPVSTVTRFDDPDRIYDAPIINDIDPATLMDAVHFQQPYIQAARDRLVKAYQITCLERPAKKTLVHQSR